MDGTVFKKRFYVLDVEDVAIEPRYKSTSEYNAIRKTFVTIVNGEWATVCDAEALRSVTDKLLTIADVNALLNMAFTCIELMHTFVKTYTEDETQIAQWQTYYAELCGTYAKINGKAKETLTPGVYATFCEDVHEMCNHYNNVLNKE